MAKAQQRRPLALVENPAWFNVSAGTHDVSARVGSGPESAALRVQLAEGQTIAAVSGSPAVFRAAAGDYQVRVMLPHGVPLDVATPTIAAGKTTQQTVQLPLGRVTVNVTGASFRLRSASFGGQRGSRLQSQSWQGSSGTAHWREERCHTEMNATSGFGTPGTP